MRRPCLDCGAPAIHTRCSYCQRKWNATRNARPERAIYGGDWPAESRAIRAETPWCSVCGRAENLTVDHPTCAVLCRTHHAQLENARRRVKAVA